MKNTFRRLKNWLLPPPNIKGVVPKEVIRPFLPKNPVIVEAGAHIGSDTVAMARLWGDATIHAFEPVPNLYRQLVKNTEGLSNVRTYPFALSETTGAVDIFVSSGRSDASSSILTPKAHLEIHPDVLFSEKINVEAITLDDWARNFGVGRVDMLWLDLQGFEFQVLQKSLTLLKNINVIYTEVSLVENYDSSVLYKELTSWLKMHGFVVEREEIAWEDGGNVLFIKKNNLND